MVVTILPSPASVIVSMSNANTRTADFCSLTSNLAELCTVNMSKNLQSTTKLTEFAPLQPEEKQQGVGQFISKFFRLNKTGVGVEQKPTDSGDDVSEESVPTWAANTIESSQSSKEIYQADEGRIFPNVLKRISNLLAVKNSSLQDYSDTELKQYWMPDSVSKECYECSEKFTTFRRKHHCRACGNIFCWQCCNEQLPGKIFGCKGDLRICNYCCKEILTYLQSSEVASELPADLQILRENLASKYGPLLNNVPRACSPNKLSPNDIDSGTVKRKISIGYQEERFGAGNAEGNYLSPEEKCKALQNSTSLRNLYEEISRPATGVPQKTLKYRLRTYNDCLLGSDIVDWLIYRQKANTRIQAAALCQALLEAGYIECVSDPCHFSDGYVLYKIIPVRSPEQTKNTGLVAQDDPIWVQQVPQESSATDSDSEQMLIQPRKHFGKSSSYTLDLNLEASTVYLSRPAVTSCTPSSPENETDGEFESHKSICKEMPVIQTSEQRADVPESGWHDASYLREENGEKIAYEILTEAFAQHQKCLLKQMLNSYALPMVWFDVIIFLVQNLINTIRPDKHHNAVELDIRHYVQFKKVPGGSQSDCTIVGGVVCSKNIAHKGMHTELNNPKVLLLHCSIVYQRTEGRFMSLDPVLMQEHEYLRHVVAKVTALKPDIVIVHRTVSRLAQDLFRKSGIVLVHNVKETVLERLSRCLEADLVTNIDAHIGRPRLGTCKRFYLQGFTINGGPVKTLMFFEGLPASHLGETVILRGASKCELAAVKKVAQFLLFATYNWRLEKSFLMDEYALPPNSKNEFFDESRETSPTLVVTDITIPSGRDASKELNAEDESVLKDGAKRTGIKAVSEPVHNFSDPLHTYDELNVKVEKETLSVAELPFTNSFRKALDGTILCVSPYVVFPIPYLETEQGKKCKLRSFFPEEIYFSKQFVSQKKSKICKEIEGTENGNQEPKKHLNPPHPFITAKFTSSCDSLEVQSLLADFRARGGIYPKRTSILKPLPTTARNSSEDDKLDVLDPINHQKLAVLFCSFSHESNNAPAFCVDPWVVHMEFYGKNDIPLGCFLERYCFLLTYACPSPSCETPMLHHVRRFVHLQGCISVSLKYIDSEFSEENIVMWSFCNKCQSVSPSVPMTADTWSYSFAKYLELMFLGGVYCRRGMEACCHSLHHDCLQYFGYKHCVATFKYTPIQLWEISLPPPVIVIEYDSKSIHDGLVNEIKLLTLRGHDLFATIQERLCYIPTELEGVMALKQMLLKEQTAFKQKKEEIQLRLTSPTVAEKMFVQSGISCDAMWQIQDGIVRMRRLIAETVEIWNWRISENLRKQAGKKELKDKNLQNEVENSQLVETTDADISSQIRDNEVSTGAAKRIRSLEHADSANHSSPCSSPKMHHRSQSEVNTASTSEDSTENKKELDKRTVKHIFSQLLPSSTMFSPIASPFSAQEHYSLTLGVYCPVVVYENELSSIIAFSLNSHDYKKSFDEITGRKQHLSETGHSPILKQKIDKSESATDFTTSLEKSSGLLSFLRNNTKEPGSPMTQSVSLESCMQQEHQATAVDKAEDTKKTKTEHIEVQFQDATCNFFCRVYFAERFSWLRGKALPDGEEAYIRSLMRSVQWNARGGKSGSNFSKTSDDRFILKEMSKNEVQLFVEWAPNYFLYMLKCYSTSQPTLLGKIMGIYQVIFKNNSTNMTSRTNLLVMENLFYNRTVSQKFDLKGSVRNRLVNPSGQNGEIVLLDENLLKMTCGSPLYILPHSKSVLTAAISSDTEFLSSNCVMDYSLLVGLDSESKELVLGIIDYIRTFTWDKKLETMVKKSGILGGQGKLPTIISPEEYQKRFIEAMHRYFLEVPDHWAGLGKGVEC